MTRKSNVVAQVALLIFIVISAYFINKYDLFQTTLHSIEKLGFLAAPGFIIVYALTCVFLIPSLFFCFAGGILFGILPGTIYSLIGQGIGSVAALLIGRYLLRAFIQKTFQGNQTFHRLDKAVEKKGWKIISLARLSPIFPFSVGNYAFGSTGIPPIQYGIASVLGSIPSTLVYTYLGTMTGDLASLNLTERERSPVEWVLLIVGFIVTILLSFYLKQVAEKALKEN